MRSKRIENLIKNNAQEIADKYLAGQRTVDIAKDYNVNRTTIDKIMKSIGVFPSKQRFINRPFTNYSNKSERDYWLGFLFGDGYIINSTLGLTLQVSDKEHLIKYATFLGTNKTPIQYDYGNISYCRVNYCHKDELEYLKTIGLVANKTFEGNYKEDITWDFINGLIDADGHIGKNNIDIASSNKDQVLHIVKFLESQNILYKVVTTLPSQKKGLTKPHFTIVFTSKEARSKIKDNLYNNSYSLDRKRIKYESFFK